MPSPFKAEAAATRYAPYIEELHEFFAGRRLQFGSPADVLALAQRLSRPGLFREEMSSMVRAIIYRESEGITRPELLELIVTASGGTHVSADAAILQPPLNQITDFLDHVLRSLWRSFPDEVDDETDINNSIDVDLHAAPSTPTVAATNAIVAEPPRRAASTPPEAFDTTTKDSPIVLDPKPVPGRVFSASSNGVFSRALSISQQPQPEASSSWRTVMWAAPVPVVLAIAAGLLLPHRSPVQPQQPISGASPTSSIDQRSANTTEPATGAGSYTAASSLNAAPAASPTPSHSFSAGTLASGQVGVFFVSSGLMNDHLLSAPPPEYPSLAKLAHVQGSVVMQAVVGPDGTVSAVHVLSGPMLLRNASEQAVRGWQYRPYMLNGVPTNISTDITVEFRLHGSR